MPVSFHVIFLGQLTDIDSVEGNFFAENAGALVGSQFGGPGNALVDHVHLLTPGSQRFDADGNTYYDMDGSGAESFRIDGGPDQVFDGTAVYNATLTYVDGTTAQISAVLFQDMSGNTYLSPEFSANADQTALEAKPIQSLSLDSLLGDNYSGMTGSRERFDYVACFAAGTRIATVSGDRSIEDLRVGENVLTRDHGAQPIRWIGTARGSAEGAWRPVRIEAGALGAGLPRRALLLSQQHRVLVSSPIAARMTGAAEVLVAAKRLVGLPGIALAPPGGEVTYLHLLLDRHEIILAEGAPAESLLNPACALPDREVDDMPTQAIYAGLHMRARHPARPIPKGHIQRGLARRHLKNGHLPLQT